MNRFHQTHLHSVDKAKSLDSPLRHFLQNPKIILQKYINSGMTVLDLGCGTGYFTLEIANRVGNTGKVIACDVQHGMLEILKKKLKYNKSKALIEIHNCKESTLGLTEKVDFIFAFYSFHEMKFIDKIINELINIVKPQTSVLISEQKFHVTKNVFNSIVQKMEANGFEIIERPRIFLSRTVIMKQR